MTDSNKCPSCKKKGKDGKYITIVTCDRCAKQFCENCIVSPFTKIEEFKRWGYFDEICLLCLKELDVIVEKWFQEG